MICRNSLLLSALAWMLASVVCHAHEGHGNSSAPGNTLTHYLTEPVHIAQFVGIALVVLAIGGVALKWYFSRSHRSSATTNTPR